MTTEKDAMALADRLREAARNPYGAVRDLQARASITAEAADTIEALIARATRAEAELVAVREKPALRISQSAITLAVLRAYDALTPMYGERLDFYLARVRQNATEQLAAIDAAKGGE